jgi:N-methylhydantoinase A
MIRIGIDVGGTFTDLTLLIGDRAIHHKTPSTPKEPALAIETGLVELLKLANAEPDDVDWIGHGATVATNMAIERKGAKTGLLTTKGFRDVLEIARQTRPNLYDYRVTRPPPLAPRRRRIEIAERLDQHGGILTSLDEGAVTAAGQAFAEADVEAVAVVFLHSYRNPNHERRASAILSELLPDAYITCSVDVSAEFREFERTSTTVLNAFVGPHMDAYLADVRRRVAAIGIRPEPYMVHSGGGLMSLETAARLPVRSCLSGPAAGVAAAAAIAAAAGFPDVAAFDVGGTSTDIALIIDGAARMTAELDVAGYPVRAPSLDIAVIGAGGGSIAIVDDAGGLTVGPASAGAFPGPAAYGLGGDQATLTDANLTLGRLDAVAGLVSGATALDAAAAKQAIQDCVGDRLGLPIKTAAAGILRVAVANIARAIRSASSERGHDLGEMALVAYGGAGPLLAADVADETGCPIVIVPPAPGTLCARGILMSDPSRDFVETVLAPAEVGWTQATAAFERMLAMANAWLAVEAPDPARRQIGQFIEARYLGQSFEAATPVNPDDSVDDFIERFHTAHKLEHGYEILARGVEIVNCRLIATATGMKSTPARVAESGPKSAGGTTRSVAFTHADGTVADVETKVLERDALQPSELIVGPAIIVEKTSTTVVPPDWSAEVDAYANLILRR